MVVYVLRYWPTLTETFVYREIADHLDAGLRVEVVGLGERSDGLLQDCAPDVVVHRPPHGLATSRAALDVHRLRHPALRWLAAQQGLKSALRAAWTARQLSARSVRRVHAHFAGEAAEVAWTLAQLLDVPFSVTCHAVDLFKPRASLQTLLNQARPAVTVCGHHRRWIADNYDVDAIVVRCGAPMDVPRASPDGPGPLRLISVGRDVPKKGVDVLLRALDRLPNVHLRWVGPTHRGHLPQLVGPLPPSQIPQELAGAHAFVLPCRRSNDGDMDGIPVVLIEAMAAGLPVITTAISGIGELVDESVGWLVPPDDVPALYQAILAAHDPHERAVRGAAGRRRVEADLDHVVQSKTLRQLWAM
jgi:colanic acid/amylovoran biosynthesis glycosyltransferase